MNGADGPGNDVLAAFGVYPATLVRARARNASEGVVAAVDVLLGGRGGNDDGLTRALIALAGREAFGSAAAKAISAPVKEVTDVLEERDPAELLLSGADVVALFLAKRGSRIAFAYPGTSELALCDRLARVPGVRLVNSRGDKEAAFMAGGASSLRPCDGVAVLHAARGLTNACGAVGDLNRNEVGTLLFVGTPTTTSAPFIPPHGEPELLARVGAFAKWTYDPTPASSDSFGPDLAAEFVEKLVEAAETACTRPFGPALFGLPQDMAEKAWIPWELMAEQLDCAPHNDRTRELAVDERLIDELDAARRPVIIIDDYLLKYEQARPALRKFSDRLGAPVLQLRYTRGQMLFERLSTADVPNFIGWYNPDNAVHASVLEAADLLVTLEDRNMYPRVIGALPDCPKVAITSSAEKVRKNRYLGEGDFLVVDHVVSALRSLEDELAVRGRSGKPWFVGLLGRADRQVNGTNSGADRAAALVQRAIVSVIGEVLDSHPRPVLVDDSQMFGGLICEAYDSLPSRTRVMASHGGFIGSGIAFGTGLALAEPDALVLTTLGDQAFTNGVQGLAAAAQESSPVTFILCNNGGASSLTKQTLWDDEKSFNYGAHSFLENAPLLAYGGAAEAFGLSTTLIAFEPASGPEALTKASLMFAAPLRSATKSRRPVLIELRLPPSGETWSNVWALPRDEAKVAEKREKHAANVRG